jgi:hypothetical protein
MPLVFGERAVHTAIKGFDGSIENAASRVEMAGPESVRITREAGAWQCKGISGGYGAELGWHPMGLKRLIIAIAAA